MTGGSTEGRRLWIEPPRVETAQGFPLDVLVRAVFQTVACQSFTVHRCSGYGRDVTRLGEASERSGGVIVELEVLLRLAKGTEQWFYDVEVSCDGPDGRAVTFGLHDSSSMFVEADGQVARNVVECFGLMQITDDQNG